MESERERDIQGGVNENQRWRRCIPNLNATCDDVRGFAFFLLLLVRASSASAILPNAHLCLAVHKATRLRRRKFTPSCLSDCRKSSPDRLLSFQRSSFTNACRRIIHNTVWHTPSASPLPTELSPKTTPRSTLSKALTKSPEIGAQGRLCALA